MKNIAIVGGGASGLFCAVALKRNYPNCNVTIYEKSERTGKKLLVTGNGRCNLTNLRNADNVDLYCKNYNASDFAIKVIEQFSPYDTIEFFHSLAMLTVNENDWVYPATMQASTVVDVLRFFVQKYSVVECCNTEIIAVSKQNGFSLIDTNDSKYAADYVIMCGGGKSGTVKNNSCYSLAKQLGHSITDTKPSLVPIKCNSPLLKGLNGIRAKAVASLYDGNKIIAQSKGEILFKDYGISGIAVLQLSSFDLSQDSTIELDLISAEVEPLLRNFAVTNPDASCYHMLEGIINKKIAQNLLNNLGYGQNTNAKDVDIDRVIYATKHFKLSGLSLLPFDMSQVTKGGINLFEVSPQTMQSKICSNLYLVGELLDINGQCGGYNLQFAFSSAAVAAKSIADKLING